MAWMVGFGCNRLIIIVLCCYEVVILLNINTLVGRVKEKVNFFEKFLRKNLEVKKKSVSLQPI